MYFYIMSGYSAVCIVMSLIAFMLFGIDKKRAVTPKKERIKEKTLLFFTVYGGGAGAFIGSNVFRHKTKKGYFVFTIFLSMVIQTVALVILMLKYGGAI